MRSDYDPRVDMRLPKQMRALYIGNGCFIPRDGHLVFVRKVNRPDWLREGDQYVIGWTVVQWGMQFHVIEAVPKKLGVYERGSR